MKLTKNKIILIICLIIVESLFLRTFHLTDWLHFQLDQSRDSFLIKEVVQKGVGDMSLLGPRAGGSFLRLGPAYYNLMYFFAKITGSVDPIIFVLPEILGSILFVPMMYLLAKMFFNKKWSLILTVLAVNSTFLITYDRFSWNPNLLPLFSAATIYAWLKYVESKRNKERKMAYFWIIALAFLVGIITQLHFVAFIAVPIILALAAFAYWLRSKIFDKELAKAYTKNIVKEVALFMLVFILTQTPIILNEYISKGINTKELFSTVLKKQGKDETHRTIEKVVENLWVYPKGYFITMTGNQGVDYPVWLFRPNVQIKCDAGCHQYFNFDVLASIIFIIPAIVFLLVFVRKTRKVFSSNDEKIEKKYKTVGEWEFLVLLTLWILVPWWSFYSLSFSLRPRFFLISIVPFWIITGILFREIAKNSLGKKIAFLGVLALFVSNIANTVLRFQQSANASVVDKGNYPQDQILFQDESYPVTLNQEEAIAQWIKDKSIGNDPDNHIFIWAPSFYYRPILYLLSNIETEKKIYYFSHNPMWSKGSYFAVTRDTTPQDFFKPGKAESFNVVDKKIIGTLAVYQLDLTDKGRETALNGENKFLKGKAFASEASTEARCTKKPNASCRYTWGDVFGK